MTVAFFRVRKKVSGYDTSLLSRIYYYTLALEDNESRLDFFLDVLTTWEFAPVFLNVTNGTVQRY